MKRFLRLLRYGLPYTLQWIPGILLLAAVGLLDNFRLLLFVPIFDDVLHPGAGSTPLPGKAAWYMGLKNVVFSYLHLHNDWAIVAFALIASTVLKGLCDYSGTYLVNYAGFGMITDLRNDLYETTLRRSSSFFHRYPTGTILSTLINDVE